MNYENCLNKFEEYVKNYDLTITEIKYKYDHTLRVVNYAKIICESENFSKYDTTLTLICSLLHDISRFEEWMEYNSWSKIDHGDLGYEILNQNDFIKNFSENEEEQKLVLNVVKYHNKYEIPENLSEKEKMILKVVRDADKIDILITQTNKMNFEKKCNDNWQDKEKIIISEEIINNVINEELVKNALVNNIALLLIKQLTFLYDINYRSSFKIIYNLNIVDEKLSVLKELLINKEQYKIIEMKFKDYLESNIKL